MFSFHIFCLEEKKRHGMQLFHIYFGQEIEYSLKIPSW